MFFLPDRYPKIRAIEVTIRRDKNMSLKAWLVMDYDDDNDDDDVD
jgi:hypothetical protein